jgi:hypothetical protein
MHRSMLSHVLPQPDAQLKPDCCTGLCLLNSSVTWDCQIKTKYTRYGL